MLRNREQRELAVMLAPYLAGIAVLIVLPAAITFGLALTEYDLIRSPRFNGLDNFRELWGDDLFRTSLRNSLMFILFAVPLRLLGAVALALLMHKRYRGVAAYRTAGYLPTVVPDVAYALLWLWIFNPLYGPLNLALGSIGGPTPSWLTDPRAAQWAVITMSLFTIGEGFIVAMATRQGIPSELYELGDIENASAPFMFWRVTLPLMAPTLLLLMFRDTIFSFQANFVPALIVTEGGPPPYATTYLPLFIYREGFEYLRYGYAAAATLTMFLVTALIVYVQYRIVRRWRHAFVV
jgi:multiple sugar transport system permease protein